MIRTRCRQEFSCCTVAQGNKGFGILLLRWHAGRAVRRAIQRHLGLELRPPNTCHTKPTYQDLQVRLGKLELCNVWCFDVRGPVLTSSTGYESCRAAQQTVSNSLSLPWACGRARPAGHKDFVKFPFGRGVVGCVAATGKCMNISDSCSCSEYDGAIDHPLWMGTGSILCFPVSNIYGKRVAVIQVL